MIHEGPGFPFFAPFVFWYLASGSEKTTLPHVSVKVLSNSAMQIVNQVNLYMYSCSVYFVLSILSSALAQTTPGKAKIELDSS